MIGRCYERSAGHLSFKGDSRYFCNYYIDDSDIDSNRTGPDFGTG